MIPALGDSYFLLERAERLKETRQHHDLVALLERLPLHMLLNEPNLGYLLAYGWNAIGREVDASEMIDQIAEVLPQNGETFLSRRLLSLTAMIELERGHLVSAEHKFQKLERMAEKDDDPIFLAPTLNNLGIIANIRCEWDKALSLFGRALTMYHQLGDQAQFWRCHHNIAMAYRQIGLYHAADTHFQHALSYARQINDQEDVATVELERALLLNLMGDVELAVSTALRAIALARSIASARLEGEALRVLGRIEVTRHRFESAGSYLEAAYKLARSTSTMLLEAEVLEEMMNIAIAGRKRFQAFTHGENAIALYAKMGATSSVERIRGTLAIYE